MAIAARPLVPALLALSLLTAGGGRAADLQWSAPRAVAAVDAAERIVLGDGGIVRLAGVRVPEPMKARARNVVAELIAQKTVRLGTAPRPYDRYGRLVAHIEGPDALWLQGVLLERGLAQVQTRPGESARAADMLALEHRARTRRIGLWADPAFAPRSAEQVERFIGSFQVVTGRVYRIERVGDYTYLNFDEEWWTDFTLRVRRADVQARFEPAGLELDDLTGRRVEVRGLVVEAGGPLIDVSHPAQIELLP